MRLSVAASLAMLSTCGCVCAADTGESPQYKAVRYAAPIVSTATWAVIDRDGANRQVTPYLSSLGGGEMGTGVIASPAFKIAAETITFTLCGHDGMGGGLQKNFIALVDAKSSAVLMKTCAPGNDAMQPSSWNTSALKGREVRIEVRDGVALTAYAWFGVGTLDAGPGMKIDFKNGIPTTWKAVTPRPEAPAVKNVTIVQGPVPFQATRTYTMVPAGGALELPVGVAAQRLYFLGGTVARGKPLELCGRIEIAYRGGDVDTVPLLVGFTLDRENKLGSPCAGAHLHASADPFQYCFAVAPREAVIEKITLRRETGRGETPRITAVTVEAAGASPSLEPLPDYTPSAADAAWLKDHAIPAAALPYRTIVEEIARANRL